jgi:hypothetical protein
MLYSILYSCLTDQWVMLHNHFWCYITPFPHNLIPFGWYVSCYTTLLYSTICDMTCYMTGIYDLTECDITTICDVTVYDVSRKKPAHWLSGLGDPRHGNVGGEVFGCWLFKFSNNSLQRLRPECHVTGSTVTNTHVVTVTSYCKDHWTACCTEQQAGNVDCMLQTLIKKLPSKQL